LTGTHTFQVQAIDKSGNVDPTPATFSWVVLTPAQAIQQLFVLSKSMNLNPAIQAMITGLLNSAANILSDNNPTRDRATCNMLNTLIIQLNIRAQNNQITPSQASELIQSSPYSLQALEKAQGCTIPSRVSNPPLPFMNSQQMQGQGLPSNQHQQLQSWRQQQQQYIPPMSSQPSQFPAAVPVKQQSQQERIQQQFPFNPSVYHGDPHVKI
jgi:hypothetical protein